MEKLLVDTDVVIDFLRGYEERIRSLFAQIERKEISASLSAVTIVELYSGKDCEERKKEEALVQTISFFTIIPLDTAISKQAGFLRRQYGLGLADSVIAATASLTKSRLFTFNTKHFRHVPQLLLFQ